MFGLVSKKRYKELEDRYRALESLTEFQSKRLEEAAIKEIELENTIKNMAENHSEMLLKISASMETLREEKKGLEHRLLLLDKDKVLADVRAKLLREIEDFRKNNLREKYSCIDGSKGIKITSPDERAEKALELLHRGLLNGLVEEVIKELDKQVGEYKAYLDREVV